MRWLRNLLVVLLIVLVIGLALAPFIGKIDGFVIISLGKTAIEIRLWAAVVLILLTVLAIMFVIYLVKALTGGTGRVFGWFRSSGQRAAQKKTLNGMIALAEGHWRTSEQLMVSAAKKSNTKMINYLAAAQAAQEQNATERRDEYLRLAQAAEPDAEVAVGLTQAQLQTRSGQLEKALATATRLQRLAPQHPHVLKLLEKLYRELGEPEKLIALLPKLKKHKVYDEKQLLQIESHAAIQLLETAARIGGSEKLQSVWVELSKSVKSLLPVIKTFVRLLLENQSFFVAEAVLRDTIKFHWDEDLVRYYGLSRRDNPGRQLQSAEKWLQTHENNAVLLLTLGRLSYNAELWGKARSYLEQSLRIKADPEACLALANTLEQLEQPEEAKLMYQQGLNLYQSNQWDTELPRLPQPSSHQAEPKLLTDNS